MPGSGPNQGPRQTASNMGTTENGVVRVVNDGFTYPALNSLMKVTLTHNGGTEFTLKIENMSANTTLATEFSPVAWVVYSAKQMPIFTNNVKSSVPLERLAEDGNRALLAADLKAMSVLFLAFPRLFMVFNHLHNQILLFKLVHSHHLL